MGPREEVILVGLRLTGHPYMCRSSLGRNSDHGLSHIALQETFRWAYVNS